MPYNPYAYQQNYQQYFPQNYNQQAQQPQAPQPPQIQNGGFVSVHSEAEARNYPVAIGTSITFKDENAPYIYNKTMGFSQLDVPKFDKYRLVKEDTAEQTQTAQNDTVQPVVDISVIDDLKAKIGALENEIEGIKKKIATKAPAPKKKEVSEDE